jgi:hypothetical protein
MYTESRENEMIATQATAKDVAQAAGISSRTKRYMVCDEYDLPIDRTMSRHLQVLVGLLRSGRLATREYTVVSALLKAINTGRINVFLLRRIREDYTPYQICGLVAKVSAMYDGEPTIGELADFWFNAHADQL